MQWSHQFPTKKMINLSNAMRKPNPSHTSSGVVCKRCEHEEQVEAEQFFFSHVYSYLIYVVLSLWLPPVMIVAFDLLKKKVNIKPIATTRINNCRL